MSDLISRHDAVTIPVMPKEHRQYQTMNIDDAYELGWYDLQDCIESLPSADRPTGKWIDKPTKGVRYTCSNCTGRFDYQWKFCPNCGAEMIREDGEEE